MRKVEKIEKKLEIHPLPLIMSGPRAQKSKLTYQQGFIPQKRGWGVWQAKQLFCHWSVSQHNTRTCHVSPEDPALLYHEHTCLHRQLQVPGPLSTFRFHEGLMQDYSH